MKVLVLGAAGQVGRSLMAKVPADIELLCFDRAGLDIADEVAVRGRVEALRPDAVINAAAYTAVDKAESDREQAYAINAHSVGYLAKACADLGAKLVHISTDFVFDGIAGRPYEPADVTAPVNAYGASKLAGEKAIMTTVGLRWLILRSAWIYSGHGHNFLLTMLRLFRERSQVNVVADQVGTPTSSVTLATCLWKAAADAGPSAILHFTDAGVASWYDFAVAIYEESSSLGLLSKRVEVVPISSEQYPTAAKRPSYSVLDKQQTWKRFALQPVHWREALREVLRGLGK